MKKLIISLSLFLLCGCEVMVGPHGYHSTHEPPAETVYYSAGDVCEYEPEPYTYEPSYCYSDGCCVWEFVSFETFENDSYTYLCEEIWCESYDYQGCGGWEFVEQPYCYDLYY